MDPNISPRRDVVTDADRAAIAAAIPHAPSTVPPAPRIPASAIVDPVLAASMVASIVLGHTPPPDLTPAARDLWNRMAADCARIRANGDVVEVPPEWFG